jgi:hypothetical protein
MKKTFKLLTVAAAAMAIFFAADSAKAQTTPPNQWRLGIGVEGGLVTGQAHNIYSSDLGGTLRLQYGAAKNLALMLTSGYYNFFGKDINTVPGSGNDYKYHSYGIVPVKAGIKAFLGDNFYLSGEVGAGFETSAFGTTQNPTTYPYGTEKNVKLLLSPGLGIAGKSWDVGVRYENFSGQDQNFGTVNLRLAYGFGL